MTSNILPEQEAKTNCKHCHDPEFNQHINLRHFFPVDVCQGENCKTLKADRDPEGPKGGGEGKGNPPEV